MLIDGCYFITRAWAHHRRVVHPELKSFSQIVGEVHWILMGIYRRSPICRRFIFWCRLNAGLEHINLAHSSFLFGRRLRRENCRQPVLVNSLPAVAWRHSNCLREEMEIIYSFRRFANLGALNESPIHHHKMHATGLLKCAVLPRALCRQKGPDESQ